MDKSEIEAYITSRADDEHRFKKRGILFDEPRGNHGRSIYRIFYGIKSLLISIIDFLQLYLLVRFNRKYIRNKRIVYTARHFCNMVDGKLVDRIVKPLFTEDIIFINASVDNLMNRVNDQKVYNLGILVKFLTVLNFSHSQTMRYFITFTLINDLIIKHLDRHEVYMILFYDICNYSLVFSKYRNRIRLVEVQHGSIINYPPYIHPAPLKIADIFYIKNKPTIEYLKAHLCRDFDCEYRMLPYPRVERSFEEGIHILYASTVDFNGFHPVMEKFLEENPFPNVYLRIRLHPREREKEPLFAGQMRKYQIHYMFDRSENWLVGNPIENLIVISPWSSCIEDAVDNGFVTIIIDPVGKERFEYLIDGKVCFYTQNICNVLQQNKGIA